MKKLVSMLVLLFVIASSCRYVGGERVRGNGVIKSENRSVGDFTAVDVSGNTNVYVKQDSIVSVRVEADENLLPYIVVENRNGTLVIHQKEGTNLRATKSVKVYLSGPSFTAFDASGACNYYTENKLISTTPVKLHLSGASDAKLELKAPSIDAEVTGAGTLTLSGETRDLSGASNAEVFASVKLDVHASGASDVRYKGNAAVSPDVSGASSVKKAE
jgi:hypothetical protein